MTNSLPAALRVALEIASGLDLLGLSYHLGGSVASSVHGVPRHTQDLDFVVAMDHRHAKPLTACFSTNFYVDEETVHRAVRSGGSFNLVDYKDGIKVDIFVKGQKPYDDVEFERHKAQVIQDEPRRTIVVKSAEDILLRKLSWYRLGGEASDRQWSDIQGIVKTQGEALDFPYLQRWAQELKVQDLLSRVLPDPD